MLTSSTFPKLVVFFLVSTFSLSHCYIQELQVHYKDTDNYMTFRSNTPNLQDYLPPATNFEKICVQGIWPFFDLTDFTSDMTVFYYPTMTCTENSLITNAGSIRHGGHADSSLDAVSLYAGHYMAGVEILIDRSPFAGITTTVGSLAGTGSSQWTLFEGQNFDGKAFCWDNSDSPTGNPYVPYLTPFDMTTIGSLFKGCSKDEREMRKMADEMRRQWQQEVTNRTVSQ